MRANHARYCAHTFREVGPSYAGDYTAGELTDDFWYKVHAHFGPEADPAERSFKACYSHAGGTAPDERDVARVVSCMSGGEVELEPGCGA